MFRLLQKSDLNKGYVELLSQLTTVGNSSKKEILNKFYDILKNKHHKIFVLEKNNKIVSCATLFIEPKFIHGCGFVGHVEDVVVDVACRGQKLGKKIIEFLSMEAQKNGCYKIILDCSDKNVGFYEKCLYERKGAYMARYLTPEIKKASWSAYKTVYKFCKTYQSPIMLGLGVAIGVSGYYMYHQYYDEGNIQIKEIIEDEKVEEVELGDF